MVWGQNQNQNNYGGNMGSLGMGSINMQGMGNYPGSSMGSGGRGILGESPGTGGMGMGGYAGIQGLGGVGQSLMGNSGGSDNIDSMIQQRRLQQQLSLRESQLALASNLLQKQNQLMMDVGLPGSGSGGSMGPMLPSPPMSRPMIPSLLDMPAQPRHGKRPVPINRDMDLKRRRRDSSSSDQRGRNFEYDRRRDRDHYSPNRRRDDPPSRRDRPSRFSRRDSGETRRRSRRDSEEYDPANPTGDEMPGLELAEETISGDRKTAVGEKSPFFCHVCDMECSTDKNFRGHMSSSRHKDRMSQVLNVHEKKSTQIQARMKAQEHLKRIEKTRVGFCKLCDQDLSIPFMRHKLTTLHKKREMQVHKGCGWCGVKNFINFSQVLKHREKESHKENAEKYGKKAPVVRKEPSRKSDSKQPSRSGKDLVTIDSVGYDRDNRKSRSRTSTSKTSSRTSVKDEDPMPELKYEPEVAVGANYVIPVSGFFCKLCHKFYNTESAAKVTHCQSQQHFVMFKKAKIAAKAKAKAALKNQPKSTSTPISDKSKVDGDVNEADNTMAEMKKDDEKMDEKMDEKVDDGGKETENGQEGEEVRELADNASETAGAEEANNEEAMDVGETEEQGEGQIASSEEQVVDHEGDGEVEQSEDKAVSNADDEDDNNLTEQEVEDKLLEKVDNESEGDMMPEDIMFEEEGDDGEVGIVDLAADGSGEVVEEDTKGDEAEVSGANVVVAEELETAAAETEEPESVEETPPAARGRGRGRARRGKRGKK